MESRVNKAVENYHKGYNCAQAIVVAYCDLMNLDQTQAYKMFEGIGGGIGGLQQTCGAFTAAASVISYHYSDGKLEDGSSKFDTYKAIQEAAKLFMEKYNSLICREILNGPLRGHICGDKVEVASKILEEILFNKE